MRDAVGGEEEPPVLPAEGVQEATRCLNGDARPSARRDEREHCQEDGDREEKHELKHVGEADRPIASERRVHEDHETADDDQLRDRHTERDGHEARERKQAHRPEHQLTRNRHPGEELMGPVAEAHADVLDHGRDPRPPPALGEHRVAEEKGWNREKQQEHADDAVAVREPRTTSEGPYREARHECGHAGHPPLDAVPTFQEIRLSMDEPHEIGADGGHEHEVADKHHNIDRMNRRSHAKPSTQRSRKKQRHWLRS